MSLLNKIERDLFRGNAPDNNELSRRLNKLCEQLRLTVESISSSLDAIDSRLTVLESTQGLTDGTVYVLNVDNETVKLTLVKGKVKTLTVV